LFYSFQLCCQAANVYSPVSFWRHSELWVFPVRTAFLCPIMWGAGVAAVPKEPGNAAKSYDLHLTSSYKPQTSWELRRCTRILVNPFWWRYAPAALISWSCVPGEVVWPAVCGWELRVLKSERPRVRGRYKQGRDINKGEI
jgi:hypothetical protein